MKKYFGRVWVWKTIFTCGNIFFEKGPGFSYEEKGPHSKKFVSGSFKNSLAALPKQGLPFGRGRGCASEPSFSRS